jgi:two-component system nitrogen regulation sensor histidine kinase NtrY
MVSEKLIQARYRYPAILVFIVLFVLSGIMINEEKIVESILLIGAGITILFLLMSSYDSVNRYISFFFHALRNNDTAIQFPVNLKNKALAGIFDGMNKLNNQFREIKVQSEYNENYYKALIHHSSSGLMVLNTNNQILLINQKACIYAGIPADSTNYGLIAIKNPEFYNAIVRLQPGDDIVYKQISGNEYHLLVFRATLLIQDDKSMKLISIHDIRSEIESHELESYRKLISVLTHEIMNLVTPLTSVASSLQSLYNTKNGDIRLGDFTDEMLKTSQTGLKLIYEHSTGLKQFVETYRKISKIPKPEIKPFNANEWIDQIRIAFSARFSENEINFRIEKDNTVRSIIADKSLLNQVIINILNNSIDALQEIPTDRSIKMDFVSKPDNRIRITVSNNGPEIPAEILDKIFVPFFTTKKTGSGIGLSICQEIVRQHKGSLAVLSPAGGSTTFVIEL